MKPEIVLQIALIAKARRDIEMLDEDADESIYDYEPSESGIEADEDY